MLGLVITYVLTYGGAALALYRPFYGVLSYIALAILVPPKLWHWSVGVGNFSEIVAIAMIIGWAFHGCSLQFGKGRTTALLFSAFWVWSAASYWASSRTEVGIEFVVIILKILIPFLIGLATAKSVADARLLAWTISLSVGFLALRENESYFQYGLQVGDNQTAHSLGLGASVAFFFAFCQQRLLFKLLLGGISILMAHAVMFHMSRGGMLGLVVLGAFIAWFAFRTPKYLFLVAFGGLIVLTLAGDSVREEFQSTFASEEVRDDSAQSRIELWKDMWTETMKHPVLGLGPQHWQMVSASYGWPEGKQGHGTPQQLACELGMPGAILWLLMFLWTPWQLIRLPALQSDTLMTDIVFRSSVLMCASGLLSWFVMQLVANFYTVELPFYVLLLAAVFMKVTAASPSIESATVVQVGRTPKRLFELPTMT